VKHLGLTKFAKERIEKLKHEAKEKINPYSATNKQKRSEEQSERAKLQQTERESYHKERAHQAEERGKRTAQHEYGNSKGKSGGKKSFQARNISFVPMDPMGGLFGPSRKPKPKVPSKTTTVRTGNKTITIKEKAEGEEAQKKKKSSVGGFDVKDPFEDFY
jgi:hypothetical protein